MTQYLKMGFRGKWLRRLLQFGELSVSEVRWWTTVCNLPHERKWWKFQEENVARDKMDCICKCWDATL